VSVAGVIAGIITVLSILSAVGLVLLRRVDKAKVKWAGTLETVLVTIGEGVDAYKGIAGDEAKTLTAHIKTKASQRGVLGDLDRVLAKHGINQKSTAELVDKARRN
jgi:hypothetical protein